MVYCPSLPTQRATSLVGGDVFSSLFPKRKLSHSQLYKIEKVLILLREVDRCALRSMSVSRKK